MRFAPAAWLLICAAAGCSTTDDRPANFTYIQAAILRPSCGTAACHSSLNHRTYGSTRIILDNYDDAYASVRKEITPGDSEQSLLTCSNCTCSGDICLTSDGAGDLVTSDLIYRMPYDAPLPDADIDLIRRWIDDGALP